MNRVAIVVLASALVSFGAAAQAVADDVAVIVHKSNPIADLAMVQLRKIVRGQETKWSNGKKIAVLMTTPGQPERDTTLKVVCGMSETDFTLHFMHASFKGEGADPPKALGTSAQVRQAVASTADAIGFIKASDADSSVKMLTVDGSSPGQPAYRLKPR